MACKRRDAALSRDRTAARDHRRQKNAVARTQEVRAAIRSLPNGKAAGDDKITADFLKSCHDNAILLLFANSFTNYMQSAKVPVKWKTSYTTLIFKKGGKEDLENYRPICLPHLLYKAFTKLVLNRIRGTLEEDQPVEQAGFCRS
uniref:Reverse transcriptase domain-containing protein n=1 Tax=Caenorhabditis japonica TaxID=281687 RepID=A0A8R1E4I0_CAEJA